MQRWLLGIIGALLVAIGGWLAFGGAAVDIGSILFRIGIVLSVLTLALPQVQQFFRFFPPWLLGCALVGALVIVAKPRYAAVVVPTLIALWFLGPRNQHKLAKAPKAKPKRVASKR